MCGSELQGNLQEHSEKELHVASGPLVAKPDEYCIILSTGNQPRPQQLSAPKISIQILDCA